MRRLAPIFGGIALVFLTFLAIGLALPGTWAAEQSLELEQSPAELFPFLADLALWDSWTVWRDFESVISDPSAGSGATRSWDDPNYGAGHIQLTEVVPSSLVRYRVELGEGRSWVDGELLLSETMSGTLVAWTESGDFGSNPLMGYMARRMPTSQRAQMLESLERLRAATPPPRGGG